MEGEVRQIAIYGKGGCGKSTVSSNLAACFQEMGRKVMQMGCSPKIDSTTFLLGGELQTKNILEYSREVGLNESNIFDVILKGYKGVWCVEAGGPAPAEGCAGRGVALALDSLIKFKVYEKLGVDFVIYDVIADVVCGGFAQPIRSGYAKEIYFVTSGELMSLYSTNNICIAVQDIAGSGARVGVAGIIANHRGVEKEEELIEEFARKLGVEVVGHIPRSDIVQRAESLGGTVIEKCGNTELADIFRGIAKKILSRSSEDIDVPHPIELQDIMDLLRKYQALD